MWATGFVATTLNANAKTKGLTRAQSFLKKQRQKPFWGYSTRWIPDLDSTTFVLMALQSCRGDAEKEFKHWTLCQRKDGGFSTYPDRSSLDEVFAGEFQNYDGWMQSHVCVSSAALYFLSQPKTNKKTDATVKKLVHFLEQNVSADGLWHSYWWTSPVYATSYALRGLVNMGLSPDEPLVAKGFNSLVQLQCDDGAFQNRFGEVSAFFTALAMLAFTCHENVFRKYEEPATRAANWLLANQLSDGSFSPAYQLQIPTPGCTQPADVASWTKSIAAGTNVLCCDIMRLFSTAACQEALQAFMKYTTVPHGRTANQSLQLS